MQSPQYSAAILMCIFGRIKSGKTELERQISYYLAKRGVVLVADMAGQWPREYSMTLEQLNSASKINRLMAFRKDEIADIADAAAAMGNCTLVVDEADFMCSANGWKSDSARNITLRGRHNEVAGQPAPVGLIVATQRPANIHGDIKALCGKVACFSLDFPRDLDAIEEWLGLDYAEQVAKLEPHYFVLYPDRIICKLGLNGPAIQTSF
jgi:hypothetical protein